MKKIGIVVLSLILLVGGLVGCSAGSKDTSSGSDQKQTESENSIVAYVGTNIFESSLDPVKGAMSYGYSFTNASLLKVDPNSEYVSDMATEWEVSDDALTYTFNVREGVKFSDGSDMTAEDIVFTYEAVKDNQAENENVDLTRLDSVTAAGDYTVVFTLSEPYSPFLDTTAMLGIVPSDSYDSEAFDREPIGTGAWKVAQYDANQQIIVEPNEYYYEGVPALDQVTLVYMDNSTALSAAQSGQLDVVMVGSDYATQSVEGMTLQALETMDIRQISLPTQPLHEHEGIMYGNDVTSDKAVREALAIGIDRASIIQNAFNGIGKPVVSFTSNLVWANTESYEDNRKDEAAQLLENAGWVDNDGDGIREKGGVVCEFDVYAAEDRYVLAAALAEDALEMGIAINPHSSNWDDISVNMNTSPVLWGWGQYSPTVLDSLFNSEYIYLDDYSNTALYANPEVDVLIEKALSEVTQEAAVADWKEVQKLANADYPYLYLVNIEHCYFVNDDLNISVNTQIPHPHGHGSPVICNMKDWTLK